MVKKVSSHMQTNYIKCAVTCFMHVLLALISLIKEKRSLRQKKRQSLDMIVFSLCRYPHACGHQPSVVRLMAIGKICMRLHTINIIIIIIIVMPLGISRCQIKH